VSSLQPRPGHWLLRCPLCKFDLTAAAGALVCRNRHSFDLAREGYVNLLPSRRHGAVVGGDGPAQLRHRAEFLDAGHLDAVTSVIVNHIAGTKPERTPAPWRILDAGSGMGHHLARLADALTGPVMGLGLDISKEAARQAARRWPTLAFAVSDLWGEWPVHDAAVDLVVSIFAPKNFAEIARVLRAGGWLALAYPGPDHLIELRTLLRLLGQHGNTSRRYADLIQRFIGPTTSARLYDRVILDRIMLRSAVLMGPNARHVDPLTLDVAPEQLRVTFDINLLFARKPESTFMAS
jgi:23S rRNA (guanine745-N1)-methyltransferase